MPIVCVPESPQRARVGCYFCRLPSACCGTQVHIGLDHIKSLWGVCVMPARTLALPIYCSCTRAMVQQRDRSLLLCRSAHLERSFD